MVFPYMEFGEDEVVRCVLWLQKNTAVIRFQKDEFDDTSFVGVEVGSIRAISDDFVFCTHVASQAKKVLYGEAHEGVLASLSASAQEGGVGCPMCGNRRLSVLKLKNLDAIFCVSCGGAIMLQHRSSGKTKYAFVCDLSKMEKEISIEYDESEIFRRTRRFIVRARESVNEVLITQGNRLGCKDDENNQ
ncbi:MAG: hypothetical protein QXS68_03005 [Candidatus Methanomethylicaceae archaeon]